MVDSKENDNFFFIWDLKVNGMKHEAFIEKSLSF